MVVHAGVLACFTKQHVKCKVCLRTGSAGGLCGQGVVGIFRSTSIVFSGVARGVDSVARFLASRARKHGRPVLQLWPGGGLQCFKVFNGTSPSSALARMLARIFGGEPCSKKFVGGLVAENVLGGLVAKSLLGVL